MHEQVFEWAKGGDIQAVQAWINSQSGTNIPHVINTVKDENENTLLGVAILNQQWALADHFLIQGANAYVVINNTPDDGNNVPVIRMPMRYNQWGLVEKLIRAGANPRDWCDVTASPLSHFSELNNIDMVQYILESDPNKDAPRAKDRVVNFSSHHSPLKLAVIAGHLPVVQMLVEAGASIENRESLDGKGVIMPQYKFTPIQYAAMFGHRDIVLYLMCLPEYDHDFSDTNIGFSFDFFDTRSSYNAFVDMNEVVTSMLPYNRFNYFQGEAGEKNLRTDLLLLQAGAKHYTLQRAIPRIVGSREEILQGSNAYFQRALLALDVIRRSTIEPPIVPISERGIDRITPLQKMMFAGFCTAIATYVRNNPDVDANNSAWKALSYLGCIIDCASDRGYFHGNQLIGISRGQIFDAVWPDILRASEPLYNFMNFHNHETLEVFKTTPLYQISSYLNDYEQLSKLEDLYLCFSESDLESGNSNRIEAVLNGMAVTIEIVTVHLSDVSRSYFYDLDFITLSQIRNHLRHVNGDNHHYDAFARTSRARRFEMLVNSQNSRLMSEITSFMRHDFAEIKLRLKSYQDFIRGINSTAMLYEVFKTTPGQPTNINTLPGYHNFRNVRRASSLRVLLEENDNSPHLQEDLFQRHLRTSVDLRGINDEPTLRQWNAGIRTSLGLTKKYLDKLQPPVTRALLRNQLKRLLPNETDSESVEFCLKIHCYLKHSANIYYAIINLQKIVNIESALDQRRQEIFRVIIPEVTRQLSVSENARQRALSEELKVNSRIHFNVIEWQVVHFHEHINGLIKEGIFLDEYRKEGGDTAQLLLDVEQIRNYIAHVANLSFVDEKGLGANQEKFFKLCRHIPNILAAFQKIQQKWQGLITELVAIVPPAKYQEIINPQNVQNVQQRLANLAMQP